jgi:tetratricopeptide (TPR) repeat protein
MRCTGLFLGITVLGLCLVACKDEGGVDPQPPLIDRNYEIQQGWSLFRMTDYDGAAIHFDRIIEHFPDAADGYIGLGWCEIQQDQLELALGHLETANRLAEEPDAIAGTAVAASALGRDSLAVEAASRCTDESYIFIGNPELTYFDLVYIRALGQFHLRRYEDCYASLRILNSSLDIDMEAFDFREQLFAHLQYIRPWI